MIDPQALMLPASFGACYYPDFQFPKHVQAFQRATMRLLCNPSVNRQIIEAPVRHGKSVWHSIIVPAWHIVTRPNQMVLLAGHASSLSDIFAIQVRELVREAGVPLDPNWQRRDSFRLLGRSGGLDSVGAGGSVSGRGYHYIAADDMVKDDRDARSVVMRADLFRWWMADLISRVEPGGKISLVMSRRHGDDLSGRMLRLNPELPTKLKWDHITFKAIDDDGKALWPQRWPLRELKAKRSEYELAGQAYQFSSLYQQDPRADPAACEWPDTYFKDILYDELPPSLAVRLRILACDPSKGAKAKTGDYCAIMLMLFDQQGTIWVDDIFARQTTIPEVTAQFTAMIMKYKPHASIIETAQFQQALADEVQRKLDVAKFHTTLYPFESTENKNVRIRMALSGWLAQGRLRVRDSIGGRLFVRQLQEFPTGEHDDLPDATAMGVSLLDQLLS